jgi:hypothetical protein
MKKLWGVESWCRSLLDDVLVAYLLGMGTEDTELLKSYCCLVH